MTPSGRRTRDRLLILLAGATTLGLLVGVSAAAFTDDAYGQLAPVGGHFDLAFEAPDGSIVQGNPEVYELDTTGLGPIRPVGAEDPQRIELRVRNNGTVPAGEVTLTMRSLLPTQPADADGVVRDPFTILIVSVWVDGALVADAVPADSLTATIPDWSVGQTRTVVIQSSYPTGLGTPFYYGRDVRLGLLVTGTT
ncbi:hypothetical protein [Microbacterium hominis]|uniref:hypothetical protein n=1 Tax=Microbacterium hominis TaxID=162426 RepID=UPI00076853EA|nr:hypothetical protein [Microbacterium hominis]KXC06629.1 hypothetical protein MhomT_04280 [Microbacterium hominis]